jgi:hypothetical protein
VFSLERRCHTQDRKIGIVDIVYHREAGPASCVGVDVVEEYALCRCTLTLPSKNVSVTESM